MAKLDAAQRKAMPRNAFAIPSKAPGSGAYPIEDASHARNALSRVAANGTPAEKAEVRSAVKRRYPGIQQGDGHMGGWADKEHPVRK